MKTKQTRCTTVQSWRVDCECGWSSRSYDGNEGHAEAERERDWHLLDAHDPRNAARLGLAELAR